MEPIPVVMARTHPPEYRLHKYWSRKPHNVLGHFLDALLDAPGRVVDPFCGSGVLLREAALRGHRATGFDLNPVAALIARVTGGPPDPRALRAALEPLLDALAERCRAAYGQDVKYVVHQTVVACPGCGERVASGRAAGSGRKRTCPACGHRLRFNLENLVATEVEAVCCEGHKGLIRDPQACRRQARLADRPAGDARLPDVALAENRRILAFAGMRVADLFTARNASLLASFARDLDAIAEPTLRDAARLLLTAAAAQCSRLIPFRNNLTTGGPAWSVPGFWVPPIHLETNPAVHLRARMKKLVAGLERLVAAPVEGSVRVVEGDAVAGLERMAAAGERADLVFLDPPYGDSVPYLEFSALWNALLEDPTDPAGDLSVSDRTGQADPWQAYRDGLGSALAAVEGALAPDGRVLVTFNNHDLRAWQALLEGLQAAGLRCAFVTYVLPAVVPAKACFSPKNSYGGDLYAVYERAGADRAPGRDLAPVTAALRRMAAARAGRVPANLAQRTAAVAWMEHNLDAGLLPERDALLDTLFKPDGPDMLRFVGPLATDPVPLEARVRGAAAARLCQGPATWEDLVEAIAQATAEVGLPEAAEIKAILADEVDLKALRRAAS